MLPGANNFPLQESVMHTVLVRIFANHPLVEACYVELLASHPSLHLVSAFEPAENKPAMVGLFDHQATSLHAVLVLSHRKFPALRPLLLLPPCDDHEKLSWLRCGLCGIVHYDHHKQDLYNAILHVANGQLWFPASVLRQHFRSGGGATAGTEHTASLTSREEEVISLVLQMRSNKEIAAELRITERTAKFHVTNILRKTEMKSRQTLLDLHSLKKIA